ncbi:MAG: DUF4169 family protein [Erythrobacter sp.]|nr:DUF4169 family protein [Erythrobacter sp.]
MAEVVNLRMARKAKARAAKAQSAAENRTRSSRSKGEKAAQQADMARVVSLLDGAKRERD